MKVKAAILIAVALLLASAIPVYASDIPPLPHAFYGTVEINDSPAPVGTEVEARGEGVRTGIEGNPIVTTEVGRYGSTDPLVVQGDIADGATLTFHVNGEAAEQTAEWHSGETTELDLSVTIAAPPANCIETNLFGAEESFPISSEGEIEETIEATSEDGMLTITIPEGTIALDEDGDPLDSLETAIDDSPPTPPEDSYIIGLAYDFDPDGATFDSGITLTWSYDPEALPEDIAEEDLGLAYYDDAAGEWVELDSVVDAENDSITASVEHFTTFAVIGAVAPASPAPAAFSVTNLSVKPAEVEPKEAVTVTISVTNTGGSEGSYAVVLKINGVKEAEKSVTVAPNGSQGVSFSVSREKADSYNVAVDGLSDSFVVVAPEASPPAKPPTPPPVKPINWPVVGGIIAGVIVVGLLIFFLVRRRAV